MIKIEGGQNSWCKRGGDKGCGRSRPAVSNGAALAEVGTRCAGVNNDLHHFQPNVRSTCHNRFCVRSNDCFGVGQPASRQTRLRLTFRPGSKELYGARRIGICATVWPWSSLVKVSTPWPRTTVFDYRTRPTRSMSRTIGGYGVEGSNGSPHRPHRHRPADLRHGSQSRILRSGDGLTSPN